MTELSNKKKSNWTYYTLKNNKVCEKVPTVVLEFLRLWTSSIIIDNNEQRMDYIDFFFSRGNMTQTCNLMIATMRTFKLLYSYGRLTDWNTLLLKHSWKRRCIIHDPRKDQPEREREELGWSKHVLNLPTSLTFNKEN